MLNGGTCCLAICLSIRRHYVEVCSTLRVFNLCTDTEHDVCERADISNRILSQMLIFQKFGPQLGFLSGVLQTLTQAGMWD